MVAVVLVLVGYGAHEIEMIYKQRIIVEKQNNYKSMFIKQIAPEAQKMDQEHHVLASVTIAQAILESDWGGSTLASKYHNLFGVKSTSTTNSKLMSTREYVDGKWVVITGRFQVYSSWADSIDAHAALLDSGTTYQGVIQSTNYTEAAKALQSEGYATDPSYASKLIDIIETYHLDQYDQ